jgi:hypothetical protein
LFDPPPAPSWGPGSLSSRAKRLPAASASPQSWWGDEMEVEYNNLKLELELIKPQMAQKPMLQAEGCACVAQAHAKIRGRGWPSPSHRARHLWVVRTLEMHRGSRLTCGTRRSNISEIKNGLSTHKAPCALRHENPRKALRLRASLLRVPRGVRVP